MRLRCTYCYMHLRLQGHIVWNFCIPFIDIFLYLVAWLYFNSALVNVIPWLPCLLKLNVGLRETFYHHSRMNGYTVIVIAYLWIFSFHVCSLNSIWLRALSFSSITMEPILERLPCSFTERVGFRWVSRNVHESLLVFQTWCIITIWITLHSSNNIIKYALWMLRNLMLLFYTSDQTNKYINRLQCDIIILKYHGLQI